MFFYFKLIIFVFFSSNFIRFGGFPNPRKFWDFFTYAEDPLSLLSKAVLYFNRSLFLFWNLSMFYLIWFLFSYILVAKLLVLESYFNAAVLFWFSMLFFLFNGNNTAPNDWELFYNPIAPWSITYIFYL